MLHSRGVEQLNSRYLFNEHRIHIYFHVAEKHNFENIFEHIECQKMLLC